MSRRTAILALAVAAAAGGAAGAVSGHAAARRTQTPAMQHDGEAVPAARVKVHGTHQAGIATPTTPQPHLLMAVLDFTDRDAPGFPARLSAHLVALQRSIEDAVEGGGADELTVCVGLGPEVVNAIDDGLPGGSALPAFAGDDGIEPHAVGGDLVLFVGSREPSRLRPTLHSCLAGLPVTQRMSQYGFRGPGEGTIARNPLGYHDGVIVPRDHELDESVWLGDGPARNGTICVVRRLRLDLDEFAALTGARQDGVIGRRKEDGAPLSGGALRDEADLTAKTVTGEYLVPQRSHVRAAHPSFTGSTLMLRRGYAYDNGATDAGLLFICFQRELETFVRTQRRLDDGDDLMGFVTPTASATFLMLPGFGPDDPLGGTIAP